ncbi:MAG: PQQ-like beta-propeller repeat protein [Labilibaculum sp.]|nr:PQQ-binding-like beta-propeller repeat protein [Labilibaculum sp.]MBI9060278.1 PQQ-like beta-propeller repeat protein [Labilibaculum sp.]
MKKKLIISMLIALMLSLSCEDSSTDPPVEQPDTTKVDTTEVDPDMVPQKNIEWSSLADTPWPIYHHDPQSTGRSEFLGPQSGTIQQMKFDIDMTMSGVVIGKNNTCFLPSGEHSTGFVSFDYNGTVNWINELTSITTPILASDNQIYLTTLHQTFLSYSYEGDTNWTKGTNTTSGLGITIDKKGNIYFLDRDKNTDGIASLRVIDKDGNSLWSLKDSRILSPQHSAPSFSPDGNTIYLQGLNPSILAVDINAEEIIWTFGDDVLLSSPVVDNNGHIYLIPGETYSQENRKMFSLDKDGNVNWDFEFTSNDLWDNTEPTIDYNGNIYFGGDSLYSLTNSGKLRWTKNVTGNISTSLLCDIENNIYFGTTSSESFYSFKENGELNWVIEDLEFRTVGAGPAITDDQSILLPSWRNALFSITKIK